MYFPLYDSIYLVLLAKTDFTCEGRGVVLFRDWCANAWILVLDQMIPN